MKKSTILLIIALVLPVALTLAYLNHAIKSIKEASQQDASKGASGLDSQVVSP